MKFLKFEPLFIPRKQGRYFHFPNLMLAWIPTDMSGIIFNLQRRSTQYILAILSKRGAFNVEPQALARHISGSVRRYGCSVCGYTLRASIPASTATCSYIK